MDTTPLGIKPLGIKPLGIKLRDWEIWDAPDLAAAINNKSVHDNLRDGIPYPYGVKDAEEYIDSTRKAQKGTLYIFAIAIACDGGNSGGGGGDGGGDGGGSGGGGGGGGGDGVGACGGGGGGGKAIGSISVIRMGNVHRLTGELGYFIAEPYWGKGAMTEAVRQMRDYIFDNTDIVRIFAAPYAHNAASCHVLEKAGFQFEGTLRHNAVKNGQLVDMKMYSVLRPTATRR